MFDLVCFIEIEATADNVDDNTLWASRQQDRHCVPETEYHCCTTEKKIHSQPKQKNMPPIPHRLVEFGRR